MPSNALSSLRPFHAKLRTKLRDRIQSALADASLQAALDGNAERRWLARQRGYASLDQDLQTLRRQAHAVRQQTIANLEEHLQEFIHRAQAQGIIVHQATDTAQACQVVLEIAAAHQVRRVAKSKTMIGEEIEINAALEQAGLQVIETDLGEYIVQLRRERPAHIITPAVHLRRADVGRLFADQLGIPYTEDVPALTEAARQALRQVFLQADLGISGVNFGVVEDGALCLVSNEGNGRLVSILPPVHIALMGIERLAPTRRDLALLLSLLPRSATGQKLTVYTSLLGGPRRPGEVDGPQERHLVLVDNGRRALRQSPLAEALLCIRCGACLNACPVFRELGGHAYVGQSGRPAPYPGPIGSVLSPGLFGMAEFGGLARASSLCGACKEACPVDIDLPRLLLRVRAGLGPTTASSQENSRQGVLPVTLPDQAVNSRVAARPGLAAPGALKFAMRLFRWLAAVPWRFQLAQRLGSLLQRISRRRAWLRLPAWSGWGLSRDFPAPAVESFQTRWRKRIRQQAEQTEQRSQINPWPEGGAGAPQTTRVAVLRTLSTAHQAHPAPSSEEPFTSRFELELIAVGGKIIHCTQNSLAASLLVLLQERGIQEIQAWQAPALPAELLEALTAAGLALHETPDPALPAGLTGARLGIAESGSLLLTHGAGQSQTPALLPRLHLAVLRAADLRLSLADALQALSPGEAANAVIITGPSRTADIEMTLTIGMHAPGELIVFLVA
jgi:L-lactate dehydrogenase complex protein LldF